MILVPSAMQVYVWLFFILDLTVKKSNSTSLAALPMSQMVCDELCTYEQE